MNQTPNTLENFKETSEITEWDTLGNADSPAQEKIDVTAVMDSAATTDYDDIPDDLPEDAADLEALDAAELREAERIAAAEEAESSEVSKDYAATDREIYDEISLLLNKDIFTAENNDNSSEIIQEKRNARNIFMEAYFRSQITSEQGNTNTSLASTLENDRTIYDKMALTYGDQFHDIPAAKHYINLSTRTTELISLVNSVKSNIENRKDPNSAYNQLANQLDRRPTPAHVPAQDNAAMFK